MARQGLGATIRNHPESDGDNQIFIRGHSAYALQRHAILQSLTEDCLSMVACQHSRRYVLVFDLLTTLWGVGLVPIRLITGENTMNIANKIMNFIKDERGAEGVEYPLIAVVVGGGAAAGVTALKEATQDKTTLLTTQVTNVGIS
jgi:Flp pilus assembly pilin Flp